MHQESQNAIFVVRVMLLLQWFHLSSSGQALYPNYQKNLAPFICATYPKVPIEQWQPLWRTGISIATAPQFEIRPLFETGWTPCCIEKRQKDWLSLRKRHVRSYHNLFRVSVWGDHHKEQPRPHCQISALTVIGTHKPYHGLLSLICQPCPRLPTTNATDLAVGAEPFGLA